MNAGNFTTLQLACKYFLKPAYVFFSVHALPRSAVGRRWVVPLFGFYYEPW